MRILVTSGATQEPIDGVRYITNFSSGRTGAALADYFASEHEVTYVHGRTGILPVSPTRNMAYTTFCSLDDLLRRMLMKEPFDLIVHAAAVSDYSVSYIELNGVRYRPRDIEKIDSGEELIIKTTRNHKIISRLKDYSKFSGRNTTLPFLAGFKLTNTADKNRQFEQARRLEQVSNADIIVHNDLYEMTRSGRHLFNVLREGRFLHREFSLEELGRFISECISGSNR